MVQPLSVVDNSDFSPTGLTFPLDSPSSSFSEGNGASSSFQAKRMLHEPPCVSTRVLSHLLVFRCLVPFSGPILVLSSREQQPGCARRSNVCSSLALHTIAPPVVSPPLPRRVED